MGSPGAVARGGRGLEDGVGDGGGQEGVSGGDGDGGDGDTTGEKKVGPPTKPAPESTGVE